MVDKSKHIDSFSDWFAIYNNTWHTALILLLNTDLAARSGKLI